MRITYWGPLIAVPFFIAVRVRLLSGFLRLLIVFKFVIDAIAKP